MSYFGSFSPDDPKVQVKVAKKMSVAYMQDSVWMWAMGTDDNSIIKVQKLLGKKEGEKVICRFRGLMRGEGITGDSDFEENEDGIPYLKQENTCVLFGNSTKTPGRISEQRDALNYANDAASGLQDWATDRQDRRIFSILCTSPTRVIVSNKQYKILPTDADATSKFSLDDIREARLHASNGLKNSGTAYTATARVRGYKMKMDSNHGVPQKRWWYVLLLGAYSALNLREDTEWIDAQKRRSDNLQFTGLLGVWEDVIVIEMGNESDDYAGIKTVSSTVELEQNLFLGATAALVPYDEGLTWWQEKIDSGRKRRYGVDRIWAPGKTKWQGTREDEIATSFHNEDYGVISIYSYKG